MPVSSIAFPRHQADVAPHVPSAALVPRPQRVSNLPHSSGAATHDRSAGRQRVERGPIELYLGGVPKEKLKQLEEMFSGRAMTELELVMFITGNTRRTPLGQAMGPDLVADAIDACLPGASRKERRAWKAIIKDAIVLPVELWHIRHANPSPALASPGTPRTLTALHELLHKKIPGVTSWKEVFPPRQTVSARMAELERVSRYATLETSVPARNGEGKPWIAAALGALLLAGGIPAAQAESVVRNTDGADAQIPLLRQHLVNVATPMVHCLAPVGSLITRYPRAVAATVIGAVVTGVTKVLHGQFGRSGNGAANSETAPIAALASVVTPDILANVIDEVRRSDASLDAEERALQAVRALGPAAEGVRTLWEIARHGRSDRLDFMTPELDIEFGGWLIKQVLGEPVPRGGIDMTWSDWTLPNGLRVILVDGKDDRVAVQLRFGYGSSIEREGQHGAVHFAEHLWFRRDLPGEQRFEDLFAAAGVKANAYTNHDTTVYYAEGPVDALELILFEMGFRLDCAAGPLPAEHFETERDVVLNEIMQRDTAAYRAHSVMTRALDPYGHPYHHSVGGRSRDLLSLQPSDMEDLMHGRQVPNLATLVISGNVDEDYVRPLVTEDFAGIEPGNTFEQRVPDIRPRTVDSNEEIFDSVPTPRLNRAWNVPQDGHPDLPALTLCAEILTHRLKRSLEKDIVFGVAYVEPRKLGSQFQIALYLSDDADPMQVEETLNDVLTTFLAPAPTADAEEVAEDDLDSARHALISSVAQTQASPDAIATAVVHCVDKGGDPDCLNPDVQAWNEATPASVRGIAKQWLARGSHTVLVTPGKRPPFPPRSAEPASNVKWDVGVPNPNLHAIPTNVNRAAPPVMPPPGPVIFPAVSRTELSNGLPLVLARMPKGENARVVFIFDGGRMGDQDPDIGLGVANVALRLITQRAGALEREALKEKLDELELFVTARPMQGYSTIVLGGRPAKLAEGVQIVRDMLCDARFPEDLFDQSRVQARVEIGRSMTDPDKRNRNLMNRLVLGEKHPYGFDPLGEGNEASFAAMTPENLALWAGRYLNPSNTTIVAVGPFDPTELSRGLEQSFGAIDGAPERSCAEVPVLTRSAHPGMYLLPADQGSQSHVMLGYPVPRGDATNEVLRACIDYIIRQRVGRALRNNNGMTYQVHSLTTATRAVRMGGFTSAVDNARGLDALEIARKVVSDLLKVVADPLEDPAGVKKELKKELERYLKASRQALTSHFNDPSNVESALVAAVDLQSSDELQIHKQAQAMESLTLNQLEEALRCMSPGDFTWILAGSSARGAEPSESSETEEQANGGAELRVRLGAMDLPQFTTIDPETGIRTVHQLR